MKCTLKNCTTVAFPSKISAPVPKPVIMVADYFQLYESSPQPREVSVFKVRIESCTLHKIFADPIDISLEAQAVKSHSLARYASKSVQPL